MRRLLALVSLVAVAAFPTLACSSDDDGGAGGASGTGGGSGSGTGGSGGSGTGGSGGSGTGGSAGSTGGGQTCEQICPKMAPLGCAKGPPNEAACTALCNGMLTGTNQTCKDAITGLLACLDDSSTYSCGADTYVTSPGCEAEFAEFNPCLPL